MVRPIRRSSNKNPPVFSHEFVIQNHADIVACVLLVIVIGLMIQVKIQMLCFSVKVCIFTLAYALNLMRVICLDYISIGFCFCYCSTQFDRNCGPCWSLHNWSSRLGNSPFLHFGMYNYACYTPGIRFGCKFLLILPWFLIVTLSLYRRFPRNFIYPNQNWLFSPTAVSFRFFILCQ